MSTAGNLDSGGGTHARFPTQTRWTLIGAARDASSPEAQAALNELCRTYWFPLYAFIRGKGNDSHKAKDLTQSFFLHFLESDFLKSVDRQKGKFRSVLLTSLTNFMKDEWSKEQAIKRGGAVTIVAIDEDEAEEKYAQLPPHKPTPTKVFDRAWAATAIKEATARLKQDYADRGRPGVYEALKPWLSGQLSPDRYPELAAELGMTKQTFEANLSRFRKEFGKSIRSVIAETVDRSEIDDEIRYLMAAPVRTRINIGRF